MASRNYRKAFEAARQEHEQLENERKRIEARQTHLQQLMVSLSPLLDEDPPEVDMGLTDAVRQALRASGAALSPPEIHARLKAIGMELPKSNPLAAIHVTLKRLIASNEIEAARDINRQKKYRWVGRNITVHVPSGTVTLTGVSAKGDVGHLTAPQFPFNTSMEAANNVIAQHRNRAAHAALQSSSGMVNPFTPPQFETAGSKSAEQVVADLRQSIKKGEELIRKTKETLARHKGGK